MDEIIDYDAVSQIAHMRWLWSTTTRRDFQVMDLQMRQIFPQELPLLLEGNGFGLVERFGDFQRAPFGTGSWRQVCVCEAAP